MQQLSQRLVEAAKINSAYLEQITVEGLAKQLCVSPSLLSHKFKCENVHLLLQFLHFADGMGILSDNLVF